MENQVIAGTSPPAVELQPLDGVNEDAVLAVGADQQKTGKRTGMLQRLLAVRLKRPRAPHGA